MKLGIILTIFLSALLCTIGCQKAQETSNEIDVLTSSDSPVTNPTSKELDAVKTPCDDASNQAEAETCAKTEFEKSDLEMNQTYQKILSGLQTSEQKTRAQDKNMADKYKKDANNLQIAQKAWLVFRDADCAAEKEADSNAANDATTLFSCQQRLTEDRTEDLKTIYENK